MVLWVHDKDSSTYRWYLQRFILDILYNETAGEHVEVYAAWEDGMFKQNMQGGGLALLLEHSLGGNAYEHAHATRASISSVFSSLNPDWVTDSVLELASRVLSEDTTASVLKSGKLHKWMLKVYWKHHCAVNKTLP